jgi:hypothetical protein
MRISSVVEVLSRPLAAVTLIAAMGFGSAAVDAAVLTTDVDRSGSSPGVTSVEIECSGAIGSCLGLKGAAGSASFAGNTTSYDLYPGEPASQADIVTRYYNLIGQPVPANPGSVGNEIGFNNQPGVTPVQSFATMAIGSGVYYFKFSTKLLFILSDRVQNVTFRNFEGAPGDLSRFGIIPLPAAAWLMLAGLGGLGLVARRRNRQQA